MRGSKAKAIRKYVRDKFKFLSPTPIYRLSPMNHNQIVLAETCQRHAVQTIKRAYKRRMK